MQQQIILMVGIPASGKTTMAHKLRMEKKCVMVEADAIRALDFSDPTYSKEENALVYKKVWQRVYAGVKKGETVIVDAPNLTPRNRHIYIRLARSLGVPISAIFMDTYLSECVQRNKHRAEGHTPERVMYRAADKLVPPTKEEGFAHIEVI